MKQFLVTLVLALAVAGMAMPQSVGTGVGPTFHPGGQIGGGVYRGAEAVWNFNDSTQIGKDYSGNGNTLSVVGTVPASGGVYGRSARFPVQNTDYASITGLTPISKSSGFTIMVWFVPHDLTTNSGLIRTSNVHPNHALNIMYNITTGAIQAANLWGCTTSGGFTSNGVGLHKRGFAMARYDGTTTAVDYSLDDGTKKSTSADCTGFSDVSEWWVMSSINGNYPTNDTSVASFGIWNTKVSDAIVTSVYNGGKGKRYEDLTAAEKVGLVSFYNLDEAAPGPYLDSHGSNDLTTSGTPTDFAGIVRTDSDSGVNTDPGVGHLETATAKWGAFVGVDSMITGWFVPGESGSNRKPVGTCNNYLDPGWMGLWMSSLEVIYAQATDSLGGYVATPTTDLSSSKYSWHFFAYGFDSTLKKPFLRIDNGAVAYSGSALPNALSTDASACNASYQNFQVYGAGNADINYFDNIAVWNTAYDATIADAVYAAGAGYFYATILDTIFHGPRFAWSQRPQARRVL